LDLRVLHRLRGGLVGGRNASVGVGGRGGFSVGDFLRGGGFHVGDFFLGGGFSVGDGLGGVGFSFRGGFLQRFLFVGGALRFVGFRLLSAFFGGFRFRFVFGGLGGGFFGDLRVEFGFRGGFFRVDGGLRFGLRFRRFLRGARRSDSRIVRDFRSAVPLPGEPVGEEFDLFFGHQFVAFGRAVRRHTVVMVAVEAFLRRVGDETGDPVAAHVSAEVARVVVFFAVESVTFRTSKKFHIGNRVFGESEVLPFDERTGRVELRFGGQDFRHRVASGDDRSAEHVEIFQVFRRNRLVVSVELREVSVGQEGRRVFVDDILSVFGVKEQLLVNFVLKRREENVLEPGQNRRRKTRFEFGDKFGVGEFRVDQLGEFRDVLLLRGGDRFFVRFAVFVDNRRQNFDVFLFRDEVFKDRLHKVERRGRVGGDHLGDQAERVRHERTVVERRAAGDAALHEADHRAFFGERGLPEEVRVGERFFVGETANPVGGLRAEEVRSGRVFANDRRVIRVRFRAFLRLEVVAAGAVLREEFRTLDVSVVFQER